MLLTSSWNCVNIFISGFRASKSVGIAPFERSAITFAAKSSASRIAVSSLMPRSMFSMYRARTMVPAENWSIHSIGVDRNALALCCQVRTSGSLPARFVRKSLASTSPSFVLMFASVCHIPLSTEIVLSCAPACVITPKFVSHDAGLTATMFAATLFCHALMKL